MDSLEDNPNLIQNEERARDEPVSINRNGNDETAEMDKNDDGAKPGGTFLPYDPAHFSLQHFYRTQNDIVAAAIVQSGMEGIDRYEISRRLGINANCKAGNRIVSASIHNVTRTYPKLFGEYQKMEGRFRVKKYYLKGNESGPGGKALNEFGTRFKELTGMDCPFKLGDVLKFPGQNINTLRISDITLKRLVQILEFVHQEKAIVTSLRIGTLLAKKEQEEGYKFMVDRKSVKKLILALAKHRLLNVMDLEVQERDNMQRVDVITIPAIASVDNPYVAEAHNRVFAEYKEANKSFPSGFQLKREPVEVPKEEEDSGTFKEEDEGTNRVNGLKKEPADEDTQLMTPTGSLLYNTYYTLERIQFKQKYGRKNVSSLSILSKKSLNSLVADIKRRRRLPKEPRKPRKKEEQGGDDIGPATSSSTIPAVVEMRKRRHAQGARLIDNVDRISLQHKAYLRSRFTQTERDMLLLIRAYSYFLNPINRFWPHPKVMRNLMHELVPQSRTKTTYSLMAAGVRELKDRQPQQQYLVKTLASYPELLKLRNQMARLNLSSQKSLDENGSVRKKDLFFMDTFRKAYELLFKETDDFPSIHANDADFRRYIQANNLHFTHVSDSKIGSIPSRSQRPMDETGIRSCVAYNAIMLYMHNEGSNKGITGETAVEPSADNNNLATTSNPPCDHASNFLIGQIGLQMLADTIENVRADGLITRSRIPILDTSTKQQDEETEEATRKVAEEDTNGHVDDGDIGKQKVEEGQQKVIRLTHYYRHFFNPDFHRNLTKNIVGTSRKFMDEGTKRDFGETEDPGEFILLANQLCDHQKKPIEFTTPNSLNELFVLKKSEDMDDDEDDGGPPSTSKKGTGEDILNLNVRATKQLRYLEDSELCLERLQVQSETLGIGETMSTLIGGLPEPTDLVTILEQLVPAEKMPPVSTGKETASEMERTKPLRPNDSEPGPTTSSSALTAEETQSAAYENEPILNHLFDAIEKSGCLGITEEELMASGIYDDLNQLQALLNSLINAADIFACGVEQRRYVSCRNGRDWLLRNKKEQGFVAKPWSLSSGGTNWKVLSWMLEGVFSFIYANPGLTLDHLIAHFSFVVQPSFLLEILEILQKIGCCKIHTEAVHSLRKTSLFADFNRLETIKLVKPCLNGLERLTLFNHFQLSNEPKETMPN